jgi:hypothetical protein
MSLPLCAPPLAHVEIGTEGYADWQEGHEFLTQYYDASGKTLLRSEAMTWGQRDPKTSQTIVPSSFQTKPQDPRVTNPRVRWFHREEAGPDVLLNSCVRWLTDFDGL